jgi:hypothetical protein
MFLANKGMTAYLMNPFRAAAGGAFASYAVTYLYEGPELTAGELAALKTAVTTGTGAMAGGSAFTTYLNSIRRYLAYTSISGTTVSGQLLVNKAYGNTVDEFCLRLRPVVTSVLKGFQAGTTGLMLCMLYDNYNGPIHAAVLMTVGLPGSGKEIEIENTTIAANDVIRVNDMYVRLTDLLGES